MDVNLGLHQRTGDCLNLGFTREFDGCQFALDVRKLMLDEKLLRFLGVVHYNTNDGAIGGIEDR